VDEEPIAVTLPRGVYAVVIRDVCGTVRRLVNVLECPVRAARAVALGEDDLAG
jgi:hypothetical protein